MSKITVTGATGFIGRHVVSFLRDNKIGNVLASGRDINKLRKLGVDYIAYDTDVENDNIFHILGEPDILIHLAWSGLPNYNETFHFEHNLIKNYRFLKNMIKGGLKSLTAAGTCYEYGLQSGCLSEMVLPYPTTSYAIAKDALRRFLEALQKQYPFRLRWARFFFLYGEGQNPRALIPQLEKAIKDGLESFNMSGGEQLRDYMKVEEAAKLITAVSLQEKLDGIFNICSGKPISVRNIAEQVVALNKSNINLKLGALPYPDHEPMAYWGDKTKLDMIIDEKAKK